MLFRLLILTTALAISGVAAYYSIIGLAAIFAAAAIPVIIMGSILEVGKLVTCLLYTSPSPRDAHESRMPSSA